MLTLNHPSASTESSADNRLSCRGAVAVEASIRAFGGAKHSVKVIDISTTGFRMECWSYIADCQKIFLTMPSFQQLEARIAWQTEWLYGCQFARPLYPAVYDHIVRTHPSLEQLPQPTDGLVYGSSAGLEWSQPVDPANRKPDGSY